MRSLTSPGASERHLTRGGGIALLVFESRYDSAERSKARLPEPKPIPLGKMRLVGLLCRYGHHHLTACFIAFAGAGFDTPQTTSTVRQGGWRKRAMHLFAPPPCRHALQCCEWRRPALHLCIRCRLSIDCSAQHSSQPWLLFPLRAPLFYTWIPRPALPRRFRSPAHRIPPQHPSPLFPPVAASLVMPT